MLWQSAMCQMLTLRKSVVFFLFKGTGAGTLIFLSPYHAKFSVSSIREAEDLPFVAISASSCASNASLSGIRLASYPAGPSATMHSLSSLFCVIKVLL